MTRAPVKAPATAKAIQREARAQLRKRKQAEKALALQEKRRKAKREKAEEYIRIGGCRLREIEVVVSRQLMERKGKKGSDGLKYTRETFRQQIVASDEHFPNMVSWKRKPSNLAKELGIEMEHSADVHTTLILFSGAEFLHTVYAIDDFARAVLWEKAGHRLIFVIWGVDKECSTRLRRELRGDGVGEKIMSSTALQEVYTHLYMRHGIETHVCGTEAEAASYIVGVTIAITRIPYYRPATLVESLYPYRDCRRTIGHCTAVIGTAKVGWVPVEGSSAGSSSSALPVVRMEGTGDLGHFYLSWLTLIPGVSLAKARAIRIRYPTLSHLLKAYDECASDKHQKSLLKKLIYGQNDRRIGPGLSIVIANAFTSKYGSVDVRTGRK